MFRISRRDLALMMIQGMIGMAGMSLFVFWGQRTTSAVNSSMIMTSIPVMILLAGFLLGEKVHWIQWVGMGIATVGCFMVIRLIDLTGIHMGALTRGDLLTFGAAACWTIYVLWGRRTVSRVGGYVYTTYVMLGALPLLAVLEFFNRGNIQLPSSSGAWWLIAYLTVFPTALAFFAWNEAQRLIGLSLLNIMQYLTPVTVLALSWPLLGEGCSMIQLAGAALVILGVGLDPALFRRKATPAVSLADNAQS